MNKKVLIVDDEKNILESLQRQLRKNFEIHTAISPEDALNTMETHGPFAVIVSDLCMPFMDGIEFFSIVREKAPDTVRIMLTGKAKLDNAIDAVNKGNIFRFLKKPFSPKKLSEVLSQGLDKYRIQIEDKELLGITINNSFKILTENKQIEKNLVESEKRLKAILENAPVGIVIIDTVSNRIIEVNKYIEQMMDKHREEIIGRTCHGFICHEPIKCCPLYDNKQYLHKRETEIVRHDKAAIKVLKNAILTIIDGRKHLIHTFVDITDRLTLEAQLLHARKLEAVGQMAAGIAHEINTPIQYLNDNTNFLKESFYDLNRLLNQYDNFLESVKSGTNTNQQIREVEDTIEESDFEYIKKEVPAAIKQTLEGLGHISDITRSLKEFSNNKVNRKVSVDINKAIKNTIKISRNEWGGVADIELNLEDSLPLVYCLQAEINQVLLNLIINAAQAINGLVCNGTDPKGIISVSTRVEGTYAEIHIRDTGAGIPVEHKTKIFDPFFTTKEVGVGTGQGLAIAHSVIVDKHNGKIRFNTEPSVGTTFIISLPLRGNSE